MVDGARSVVNQLLADVYVFTDHMSGSEAGASPGYGIMLVAETTSGRLLAAEYSTSQEAMVRTIQVHEGTLKCCRNLFVGQKFASFTPNDDNLLFFLALLQRKRSIHRPVICILI